MEQVADKVAFITGAASGIGLGMAKAFTGAGIKCVLADVQQDALDAAMAEFSDSNVETMAIQVDVSSREAMAAAADQAEARFGRVHILCNNAGVVSGGASWQATKKDWDWVLGVNLSGVVNGMMTFAPRMIAHGEGGHIINTSSILGQISMPGQSIYCASKFGVLGLSESARADLAPHNVGVSTLCPGMIATNIVKSNRNRPADLSRTAPAASDQLASDAVDARFKADGLDPVRVGEQVLEGIRKNKQWIFTHEQLRAGMAARFKEILDSFDGSEA